MRSLLIIKCPDYDRCPDFRDKNSAYCIQRINSVLIIRQGPAVSWCPHSKLRLSSVGIKLLSWDSCREFTASEALVCLQRSLWSDLWVNRASLGLGRAELGGSETMVS